MEEEDRRTLWCGNLFPAKITDELLFELFLQAGPVEKVSIPREKDGKFRTYGFITFKHEMSVPYAIQLLEGTSLFGRNLMMKSRNFNQQSQPRTQHQQQHQGHHRSISMPTAIGIDQMMLTNEMSAFSKSLLTLQGVQAPNYAQSNMMPQSRNYQHQNYYQHNTRHQDRSSPHQRSHQERNSHSRSQERSRDRSRDRSHRDKPYHSNRRHH